MKNLFFLIGSAVLAAGSAQAAAVLLNDDFSSSTISGGNLLLNENETPPATNGVWNGNGNWTIGSGAMSLSGTAAAGEGGIGRLINLTGITDTSLNQITLSIDFTTTSETETLFVHLRGFAGGPQGATTDIFNQGASNGNAWDQTGAQFTSKYHLNTGDAFSGSSGTGAGAAVAVTNGIAGLHNFSQTFDLSDDTITNIAGYDYLAVIITRNGLGTLEGVSIDSINVTAIPEPSVSLLLGAGALGLVIRRRRA